MVPELPSSLLPALQLHGQRESISHGQHAQGDPSVPVQLFVELVDGHGVKVVRGGV